MSDGVTGSRLNRMKNRGPFGLLYSSRLSLAAGHYLAPPASRPVHDMNTTPSQNQACIHHHVKGICMLLTSRQSAHVS
ncbi:hypothetical protein Pmani_034939 [Petrolisthes manimaculis]|uniref:Uncharacterized protein n=1 Tax=Petrolisthes manimaculis TaxID=1843537 RepID=A0AAE1NNA7_9EUCA|nr:hypothetical protein Pmani_034939 [Petrolisthes manimaculis]